MGKYNGFTRVSMLISVSLILGACASAPEPAPEPVRAPAKPLIIERQPAPVAAPVRVRDNAPLRYIVKPGDTLWDIAARFIRDPWQWPEVWVVNRQVKNPHLIYPGDVLELRWRDGQPLVERTGKAIERVSPQVRATPLDQAVPAIPIDVIRNFLRGPRLITAEDLKTAPYVVAFEGGRVLAGTDTDVYVTGLQNSEQLTYSVIKVGKEYRDPDDGDLLGYEAIPESEVEVRDFGGEVATMNLVKSFRETRVGSRLLPVAADEFKANFFPHAPDRKIDGKIISVFDGVSQIGQYQIVALNRGERHGLVPGHVLSIYQRGGRVDDPVSGGTVKLPDVYAGMLMVFKTSARLSYGLVMSAERAIHLLDRVDKPQASN